MKKLMIVLFLIGGLLMINPMDAFLKSNVGNMIHRKNLTTGIIKVVNANNSFNVEIGNSGKIRKGVFTLSPDPDLAAEDKVRVGYLHGSKEDPIIFAPTKQAVTTIRRYALIVASPNELQLFDMDGALVNSIEVDGWGYSNCGITMDSQRNIYLEEGNVIKKYDSNLNLLVTKNIGTWIYGIEVGPNGYVYTKELGDDWYIVKRNASDLSIVDSFYLGYGGAGMAYWWDQPALDSNGNMYTYAVGYMSGWYFDIFKYDSVGNLIGAIYDIRYRTQLAGMGICGNYLYIVKDTNEVIYVPLDLSEYHIWDLPSSIAYSLTVADGHLILSGWDGDNDGATSKYDSDRNLIWTKKLTAAGYAYKAGGYNF